jgi:hypothetical protein
MGMAKRGSTFPEAGSYRLALGPGRSQVAERKYRCSFGQKGFAFPVGLSGRILRTGTRAPR